jgi:hypothetical protein
LKITWSGLDNAPCLTRGGATGAFVRLLTTHERKKCVGMGPQARAASTDGQEAAAEDHARCEQGEAARAGCAVDLLQEAPARPRNQGYPLAFVASVCLGRILCQGDVPGAHHWGKRPPRVERAGYVGDRGIGRAGCVGVNWRTLRRRASGALPRVSHRFEYRTPLDSGIG